MLANTMPVGLYGVERIPIDPRTDEEIIEESKQRLPIMPVQRRVQAPVKPTKNPVEQAEDLKLIQLEQRLADVDEALKKIPEGQMTDETMWGLGLEDAYKQATAQITAYTKQKDAFIMHRENQERPAFSTEFIKHAPDGDENQPHRSNSKKVPFYNHGNEEKTYLIRKLGQNKENKSKTNNKPKYEPIKIAKPELLGNGF